ncbi:MAG: SGNH/GDSL hydrolase family protein [Amaricoccus sp.]|uniref:SGNH/GDSL hydrolase family protein n=1 Tax=Amaricoccus sp. TaxID=1872485 RepID=UPI0039E464DF
MPERVVLAYGDSNTHGTVPMATLEDQGRFGPAERWPGVCAAALGPGWRVVEEGLPGRTTVHPDPIEGVYKNGLAVLPAILESHRPIDLVVLMLGTNDLKQRFSVTPLDISQSVSLLLHTLRHSYCGQDASQPRMLVVAPMPIEEVGCLAEMFLGGAAKSRGLAAEYARVAARHGAEFLDAGEVISVSPVDGIHFDAAAHAALGRAIAAKIATMNI